MRVVVGVQGVQGCGKSTMCARIAREDATVDTVSLDDFYFPHATLRATTRGLPGTHDVEWLCAALRAFRNGSDPSNEIRVPWYDKTARGGCGDRGGTRALKAGATTLLVEGWCLGFVGREFAAYEPLRAELSQLVVVECPSLDVVHAWRRDAEPAGSALDVRALVDAYMPYYRAHLPELLRDETTARIRLDAHRHVLHADADAWAQRLAAARR